MKFTKKNLDALEHIPKNIQPVSYTQRLMDGAICAHCSSLCALLFFALGAGLLAIS